jgi:hypothetical protein
MSRIRRQAPKLEALEGKLLLSTTTHPAQAARQATLAARQQAALVAAQSFTLNGSLQVPTTSVVTFQQNGQHMGSFKVRGKLGTMGQVTGTFVAILDSTSANMTAGALVLNGRHGSVTLSMATDPVDTTSYDFVIYSGSGSYANVTGSGKMSTSGVANNGNTLLFSVTMK